MTIDHRTRLHCDLRELSCDDVFDSVLPTAVDVHGELAGRGVEYKQLPPLGLEVAGRSVTMAISNGALTLHAGLDRAGIVAVLAADALSDLVQDSQSTMGLAMTSRVKIVEGSLNDWIAWEPALRALLDGRPVHETGDIDFHDAHGAVLDLDRTFTLDDDRSEVAHFLAEAGFLHLRGVFTESEMAKVSVDLEHWLGRAEPDDGESWWATDAHDVDHAVRVLWFHEKSAALADLLFDDRLTWLAELTGDDHAPPASAEGLLKPLDIVNGLSDLPWHKDCGQGRHSFMCNAMTVGISVTGADRESGALGVIPGSHRANTISSMRDPQLDLASRLLETVTGDLTVHCSDTLHRAYPPKIQPRQVVYTGFRLRPSPEDEVPPDPRYSRRARADLTSVRDRIERVDNTTAD